MPKLFSKHVKVLVGVWSFESGIKRKLWLYTIQKRLTANNAVKSLSAVPEIVNGCVFGVESSEFGTTRSVLWAIFPKVLDILSF